MNDVTGKLLSVDDKVVLIPQGGYTESLSLGVIVGFTSQKIRIQLTNITWKIYPENSNTCLKYPAQVAKV